jgi:hypothetical protein
MAWRPLPPRLRHRTRRVHPLEALPPLVLTPVLLVAWVTWPFVLAAVTIGRGDRIWAAAALSLAIIWTAGIVKERRLVLGMLFAWPSSVWSAVQQWRGRVNTEDLEEGRFVTLAEAREPDEHEQSLLDVLVAASGIAGLRRQAEHVEVIAECLCGCRSIRLLSRAPAIAPAAPGGEAVERLDVAAVGTGSEGRELLVRLRVALGTLRELEVTAGGVHDGSGDALPDAPTLRFPAA